MTIEEKLEKAIAFIESVKNIDKKDFTAFNLDDIKDRIEATATCDECGCESSCSVELAWPSSIEFDGYINASVLDDLSDKAWHVLADLSD